MLWLLDRSRLSQDDGEFARHRYFDLCIAGFSPLCRLAEIMRGVDQRDMRQRLREIAGLAPRLGIVFFRKQAEIVGDADHALEQACAFSTSPASTWASASHSVQARNAPSIGCFSSGRHLTRIVPQHQAVAHHVPLDRRDRAANARIRRRQEADCRQQQQAGIEQLRAIGFDEGF